MHCQCWLRRLDWKQVADPSEIRFSQNSHAQRHAESNDSSYVDSHAADTLFKVSPTRKWRPMLDHDGMNPVHNYHPQKAKYSLR